MEATSTERMNLAISMLRNDLTELRSQDIHLMKQLFNINNAIRQITKDRLCQHVKPCLGYKEHLTKRQLSLPQYVLQERQIMDSTSSTEEYSEDISDWSETDDELFTKSASSTNYNSVLSIIPLTDDENEESSDEEILKTNIKLWKYSNNRDS